MNIDALQSAMRESGIDASLILSPENRRYFTAFPASDGVLAVCKNECVFYTDSRYIEAAKKSINFCEVKEGKNQYGQLKELFNKNGVKTVAIEADRLTLTQFKNLTENEELADFNFTADRTLDSIINLLRSVKSDGEIRLIKQAQSIAEKGLDHILGFIKPGMTEKQVQLELDFFMLSNGAEALSFETIAIAGQKTSMPHGVPSDNIINDGDLVTLDFGAVVNGYHSDMTRTFAVGHADSERRKIYETVLAAHINVLENLNPGMTCKEADALARDVIDKAGFGSFFGHGTGHGVGIEIHEFPSLSPRSNAILAPGQVVTDEPGIYLPGKFGVRIEDMLLVTENGCQTLANAPKELIIV